ncbi:unnamed protein product [Angiostrongylus costaricensis]|uniref:G_PROTEIN_RECEP_F1_2 domain-containing protein n=1 Tax=Angiostrongylus costaricensis TaxID=334426 RepID=A0A0R3PG89_ANGCS|nr:unnamed protein product [Angiostrongylus costaricensis]
MTLAMFLGLPCSSRDAYTSPSPTYSPVEDCFHKTFSRKGIFIVCSINISFVISSILIILYVIYHLLYHLLRLKKSIA